MGKPKITFYFDIVSPFGYLAYYVTRHAQTFEKCEMTYVPILLGGIMKAVGNIVPLNVKNKDKWINLERKRWAELYNIPIASSSPDGFPVLTITTQRALTAVSMHQPEQLVPAIDALYKAFWLDRNEMKVNQPEGLVKVLGPVLGGEEKAKKIVEQAGSAEVKKLFSERGDQALNDGAFGVPAFVATNPAGQTEFYWGFDHIGQMLHHLGLEKLQPLKGGNPRNAHAML